MVRQVFLIAALAVSVSAGAQEAKRQPSKLAPVDALELENADLRVALAQCQKEKKVFEVRWRYQLAGHDTIDPQTLAIIREAPPKSKAK